jgi:hypothetical protein
MAKNQPPSNARNAGYTYLVCVLTRIHVDDARLVHDVSIGVHFD